MPFDGKESCGGIVLLLIAVVGVVVSGRVAHKVFEWGESVNSG